MYHSQHDLKFDGLNVLWEKRVNWKTLNPEEDSDDESEESDDEDEEARIPTATAAAAAAAAFYHPTFHTAGDGFVATTRNDLIAAESGIVNGSARQQFEKLQDVLAKHLQIMYREGKLQWPKIRKYCESDEHNTGPRMNFPRPTGGGV